MVHEQEVRAGLDGLVNCVSDGIDSEQDARDFGRGVTGEESRSIPLLGAGDGPETLHCGANVSKGLGHS